jgi:tight adherence protein B
MLAAGLSALGALLLVRWIYSLRVEPASMPFVDTQRRRWLAMLRLAATEGRIDKSFGSRRLLGASLLVGAVVGYSLGGPFAVPIGSLAAPLAMRSAIRARGRRYAAQNDACAAELAQALASSLAGGRSVRGALLAAPLTVPDPISAELDRVGVDLTLGAGVPDALGALCERTGSRRVETLAGAIELHRGSGGDLVKLMRELAEAFRERDRALRDAHAASAQARFTAYIVAAIPITVLLALELASPGSVSGALALLPTALMLLVALILLTAGALIARRLGSVCE